MTWYEIFPNLLNMSLTASVIIVFVLLARLLLKKAPKIFSYALWAVVLFRLLCPVSFEASFSILGAIDTPVVENTANTSVVEYVPSDIVHTENPQVELPIPGLSEAINETLPQGEEQLAADPLEAPVTIATYLWLLGMAGMLVYSLISYGKVHDRMKEVVRLHRNIYVGDYIPSPFVTGILRPRIYLPSLLKEQERAYIIQHEQHHIKRGDHLWKAAAYLALCLHWFNPLVWVAFVLSAKDMEMSCDEAVIRKMGANIRADYSASLLQLATGQRILFGTPLAFGEGDTKGRIRNLARWKKPGVILTIVAALVCIVAILVCLFNPKEELLHAPEPFGHTYATEEMLYETPNHTADIQVSTQCLYALNIEYGLDILEDRTSNNWLHPGVFQEIKLSKDNFDNYFRDIDGESGWVGKKDLSATLRRENKNAWHLIVAEGLENSVCYYLLEQKNGELYLIQGLYDAEKETEPASDDSYMNWVSKLKMTEELSCTAVSEGLEAHMEPGYYPEGFDFDYENLVYGEINDSGKLIFEVSWDTDTLVVSEDYYTYSEGAGTVEKETYELQANEEGLFELEVSRRNDVRDEEAVYFVQGEEGVFVMKILFPLDSSIAAADGVDGPEQTETKKDPLEEALSAAILGSGEDGYPKGYFHCESHVIFDTEIVSAAPTAEGGEPVQYVTVYAMILDQKYDLSSGAVADMGGSHMPAAMTFEVNGAGEYTLTECWFAMDGSYYETSIREKFPDHIEEEALDTQKYILAQIQNCYDQAVRYGNLDTDAIVMKLLDEILASSGLEAESGLALYIQNERITYRELTYYGTHTLKACFREFLKGGQTDLRGLLMAEVCKEIMAGFGEALLIDYEPANGQEWFDAFAANAKVLGDQFSKEELIEIYPASWILLEMEGIEGATAAGKKTAVETVVLYEQPEKDKVCIRVQPSTYRERLSYFYIPTGENQKWLLEQVKALELTGEPHDRRWEGEKEAGWWLVYENEELMVFEGGVLYQTYHDEEKGMMEHYIEAPELCSRIQEMLEEELDYKPFDATQIKDIQSATLEVSSSYTDGEYYKQTITDEEILKRFEDWFSNAEYIYGGADCGNQSACLELTLGSGQTVRLSVATDSCSNFGINGVYYDYRPKANWDNTEFFECFDEIPWVY